MSNTNYIGGIVKIIESPKFKEIESNTDTYIAEFRVQLPQMRQDSRIIKLVFWDKLAHDLLNYYKINDYIIIEGYLSFRETLVPNLFRHNLKQVEVNVLKVYPFLLKFYE